MRELLPNAESTLSEPLPLPRTNITIRPGVLSDIPFLDSLQKLHTKQVGWMPTAQFEGKIKLGHVLVAEERVGSEKREVGSEEQQEADLCSSLPASHSQLPTPLGYCIGNDQYFKRDDVGIIYQMNVLPGKQRGLIGAALLKAMFEQSAWGCRLYCCWCAQDIAANQFWEAMGFVPLAFRTGSRTKGKNGTPRVHIFWQKRIRAGDVTTPWWFPSQTGGGSIREDRIVLPIPPGTHWSEAKPMILPGMPMPDESGNSRLALPGPKAKRTKAKPAIAVPVRPADVSRGGFWFAPATPTSAIVETLPAVVRSEPKEKRVKPKNDPRLIAAARELRDRWLEQVNATPLIGRGKYELNSTSNAPRVIEPEPARLLIAA